MQKYFFFLRIFTLQMLIIVSLNGILAQQTNSLTSIKPKMVLSLPKHQLGLVSFSPDGKSIAIVEDGGSDVWLIETSTGQRKRILTGDQTIFQLSFSSDGQKLIATTVGKSVNCWDVNSDNKVTLLESSILPKASISADGETIASGSIYGKSEIKLWNSTTGQMTKTFSHPGNVIRLTYDPTGQILASSNFEIIYFWDAKSYQLKTTLIDNSLTKEYSHKDTVYGMQFSPKGDRLVSYSRDRTVKIWEVATGKLSETLEFEKEVATINFSPNGELLATGFQNGEIKIWNLKTGKSLQSLIGHKDNIYAIKFSNDGEVIATADKKNVKIWDVKTGILKETLEGASPQIAFSPTDRTLVTAGQKNTILIWDTK
ncbi:MAG: hypothetical protein K1X72_11090 [Pyrinomonadaceae bacterium]|nr:hypothetical protein [Pyrinomonadaceae bacterium]